MATGPVTVSFTDAVGDVIGRSAKTGDPIFLNDEISTGPETNLQILLKDQTLFTLGPDAAIVFDEFIYDPSNVENAALTATVKKGVFKFISGKVSSKNPEAMTLKLPNATASIRGTTVAGRVNEDGKTDIVLLSGAIAVSSPAAPEPVDIFQSGWGTSISAVGMIDEPFVMPADILSDILSEATVSSVLAAVTQAVGGSDENGDGGDGDGDEAALTPQQEVIAEFTQIAVAELAENGEEEVSFGSVIELILQNDDLRALLIAQGLDPDDAPDINYAYLDTQLVSMLASGASPEYMRLQDNGDGSHSISHVGSSSDINDVVSGAYAGSVRFASSDLAFAARGNATSAGGSFSYDYLLNYDTANATGSFSVSSLEIDGVQYGSGSEDFNTNLHGNDQAGFEGDEDMIMNVGDEVFEVNISEMYLRQDGNEAHAQLTFSIGSITDGSTVIDGLLGSTNLMINDTGDGELRVRAEKHEVGRPE